MAVGIASRHRAFLTLLARAVLGDPNPAILITFLLLAVAHAVVAFSEPVLRNSDQINIGIMALARVEPALFARDYLFADRSLYDFYTPAFLAITNLLTNLTGSFKSGLALLVPVLSFVYMAGMYRLVHAVCESRSIALLVAIVSAPQQWALGATFWGAAGLNAMLPRTVFCAAVPWLVQVVLRFHYPLQPSAALWFGLATGVLANLHPVSAFHFSQLVLLLMLLAGGRASLPGLAAAASGMVIGALPIIVGVLGTAAGGGATVDFAQFAATVRDRFPTTIFPFPPFNVFGVGIDARAQTALVWAYLAAVAGWLVLWRQLHRSLLAQRWLPVLFLSLLIIQVPIAYLLLSAHRFPLVLAALSGGVAIVWWGRPNRQDWLILGLLSLTVFLSFILPSLLQELWESLQLTMLTTVMAEQSRAAQFVYLPFYLLSARLLQLSAQRESFVQRGAVCVAAVLLIFYPVRREVMPRFSPLSSSEQQRLADDDELYSWAQRSTSQESLFFYDSLPFRLHARRSITHCRKDLGIAYYSTARLLEFQHRVEKMEGAYASPDSLEELARQVHADYVVVTRDRRIELALPIAFHNASYTVYALDG